MKINFSKRILRKLRSAFWNIRYKFSSCKHLKNVIVFESSPDLSDNTKAVFDEMLRRNINQRYKMVWILYQTEVRLSSDVSNVYYLPHWDPQAQYYCKTAKIKICCNRFFDKESADHFKKKKIMLEIISKYMEQNANGRITQVQFRNKAMTAWKKRLADYKLVVVCGSTASVPVTADLMA